MSDTWKRPDSVPFPFVWRRFNGAKSGREYWIQDIPDKYMDTAFNFLCDNFLRDESLCRYSRPPFDEVSFKEAALRWKSTLPQKLGLLCMTKDDEGKEVIVGVNATYRVTDEESYAEIKTEKLKKVFGVLDYVHCQRDPFKEFNIDAFLGALGLVVLPEFRGENIGLEMLKAREPLCKAFGIKATLTTFTGIASQTLAVKAGFKDFVTVDYDELEKIKPMLSFPGLTQVTKSVRYMYILYE